MMSIEIMKAGIDDVEAMSKVHALSWRSAYKGILPSLFLAEVDEFKWIQTMTSSIQQRESEAWKAVIGDLLVGCTFVGEGDFDKQLELISLYVLPEYVSMGIGSRFLEEIETYARSQEFTSVGLWVLGDNVRAIGFYEKHGYVFTEDTVDLTIKGTVLMEYRYVKVL